MDALTRFTLISGLFMQFDDNFYDGIAVSFTYTDAYHPPHSALALLRCCPSPILQLSGDLHIRCLVLM